MPASRRAGCSGTKRLDWVFFNFWPGNLAAMWKPQIPAISSMSWVCSCASSLARPPEDSARNGGHHLAGVSQYVSRSPGLKIVPSSAGV
jgi:hypothetical protein